MGNPGSSGLREVYVSGDGGWFVSTIRGRDREQEVEMPVHRANPFFCLPFSSNNTSFTFLSCQTYQVFFFCTFSSLLAQVVSFFIFSSLLFSSSLLGMVLSFCHSNICVSFLRLQGFFWGSPSSLFVGPFFLLNCIRYWASFVCCLHLLHYIWVCGFFSWCPLVHFENVRCFSCDWFLSLLLEISDLIFAPLIPAMFVLVTIPNFWWLLIICMRFPSIIQYVW